jgi:hypothetical protein
MPDQLGRLAQAVAIPGSSDLIVNIHEDSADAWLAER